MILLRIRTINIFSCASFHKSEPSGNCLYSFVSLAMIGDNSLIEELRVMVSKFGQYGDQICGGSKIPRLVDEL